MKSILLKRGVSLLILLLILTGTTIYAHKKQHQQKDSNNSNNKNDKPYCSSRDRTGSTNTSTNTNSPTTAKSILIINQTTYYEYGCEIVIYGSTPAGITAAIAASRTLTSQNYTTLLNPDPTTTTTNNNNKNYTICLLSVHRNHIGGMTTSGLSVTDTGPHPEKIIGGLAKEFYMYNTDYYYNYTDYNNKTTLLYNVEAHVAESIFRTMIAKEGTMIQLFENTGDVTNMTLLNNDNKTCTKSTSRSIDNENNNNKNNTLHVPCGKSIQSIQTTTTATTTKPCIHSTFYGKIFIDASYEGDLIASIKKATTNQFDNIGLSTVLGRENRTLYNESYNGNLLQNDAHQFIVPVNPYYKQRHDNGTVTKVLLPYLMRPLPSSSSVPPHTIVKEGDGDGLIQAYTFRLCLSNHTKHKVPMPQPINYEPYRWELFRRYMKQLVRYNLTDKFLHIPTSNTNRIFPSTTSRNSTSTSGTHPLPQYKYDCNNGGPISTDFIGESWLYPTSSYEQRQQLFRTHQQYMLEYFYFLTNDPIVPIQYRQQMKQWGLCNDEFRNKTSNNDTDYWPPQLYIRESYRIVGDIVFTQHDIDQQYNIYVQKNSTYTNILRYNSIGLGSYNYDAHTAQRMVCTTTGTSTTKTAKATTIMPYHHLQYYSNCSFPINTTKTATKRTTTFAAWNEGDLERSPGMIYQIPVDVLFPKRIEVLNLLVPTCPSTSHVTFNTLRMEPQFMILGQAAGTIASMTIVEFVRNVNQSAKQQQLQQQQQQPSTMLPILQQQQQQPDDSKMMMPKKKERSLLVPLSHLPLSKGRKGTIPTSKTTTFVKNDTTTTMKTTSSLYHNNVTTATTYSSFSSACSTTITSAAATTGSVGILRAFPTIMDSMIIVQNVDRNRLYHELIRQNQFVVVQVK